MKSGKRLLTFIVLLILGFGAHSQSKFTQRLEWRAEANAFEYKVEVVPQDGSAKPDFYTTDSTSIKFSKPAGLYKYRVYAYDLLGRESSVSEWRNFEISKALQPKIQRVAKNAEIKVEYSDDGKISRKTDRIEVPVDFEGVFENSEILLVNVESGETVKPVLTRDSHKKEVLVVEKAVPGNYRIRIKNPGGLVAESEDLVSVVQVDNYDEVMAKKLEREQLAAKEAKRAEEERIAAEEAKRAEEERVAAEEAKRAEEERIAAEEAKRAEEERIAAEEAKRAEEERIAAEEAKRAEEERIAAEEAKRAEKKQKSAIASKAVLVFAGADVSHCLYDGKFFDLIGKDLNWGGHLRVMVLPVALGRNTAEKACPRIGIEGAVRANVAEVSKESYRIEYTITEIKGNLVYRQPLAGNWLFGTIKAGAGLMTVEKTTTYSTLARNESQMKYGYPMAQGGASLMLIPSKIIAFELGVDFAHQMIREMPTGTITPYFSLGLWL